MAFDVSYRYCSGSPVPLTEVVLTLDSGEEIIIAPDEYGEELCHLRVGGGDGDPFFSLSPEELDGLIAELQRLRAGCFIGEWPRVEKPDTAYRPPFIAPCPYCCDSELRRLLEEEAEIERRSRAQGCAATPLSAEEEEQTQQDISLEIAYAGEVLEMHRTRADTPSEFQAWIASSHKCEDLFQQLLERRTTRARTEQRNGRAEDAFFDAYEKIVDAVGEIGDVTDCGLNVRDGIVDVRVRLP